VQSLRDRRVIHMAGLILMALTTSCSRPGKPLAIPALEEVTSVKVMHLDDELSLIWKQEIKDSARINEILAHFRTHNTGYRTNTRLGDMLHGTPNHEYTMHFAGKDVSPLIIWIGPDWLEGQDLRPGEPWTFRHRPMSASELKDLLAIVDRDTVSREGPAPEKPIPQSESEPWDWANAADRFNREKGPIAAILLDADKVEPYKIGISEEFEFERGIDSQTILYKAKPLSRNVSTRLATLLLDPRSYESPGNGMKPCIFEPGVAFRFWKRGQFLDVLICFSCNQLMVVERDPAVPFNSLGGAKARFRVGGDFDPVLGYMSLLMTKAFPEAAD
jgi:hypothetical protein